MEEPKKEESRPVDPDIEAKRASDPAPPPAAQDPEAKRDSSLESPKPTAPTDVPPLGVLPVPTAGPPLLVTDSWRRANKSVTTPDIPTPPSQQSSSDSVFTDPEDITMVAEKEVIRVEKALPFPVKELNDIKDNKDASLEFKSPFSLSRHKKIELTPACTKIGKFKYDTIIIVYYFHLTSIF